MYSQGETVSKIIRVKVLRVVHMVDFVVYCKVGIIQLPFDVFPMEGIIYHVMFACCILGFVVFFLEMGIFVSSQEKNTFIEPVRIKCLSNAAE